MVKRRRRRRDVAESTMDDDDDVDGRPSTVALQFDNDVGMVIVDELPTPAPAVNATGRVRVGWASRPERALMLLLALTLVFMVVEFTFALISGALALFSDAFHMLSDALALVVALVSMRLARRPSSEMMSYGWARAETIGALANGVYLAATAVFISVSSIERFIAPTRIDKPLWVVIVGACGLAINLFGVVLLGGHAHERDAPKAERSLNVHGALLHMFGDALGSLAAVCSGLVVLFVDSSDVVLYVDPALSLVFALIVGRSAVPLLRKSTVMLMQGTPADIKHSELAAALSALAGVDSLHSLHVWSLTLTRRVASVHVRMRADTTVAEYCASLAELKRVLHDHDVHASTIQPHFAPRPRTKPTLRRRATPPAPGSGDHDDNDDDDASGASCCADNSSQSQRVVKSAT